MNISDVYRNAIYLEPGSAYELCANRYIDMTIIDPGQHSKDFPAATLVGRYGNFGILLNKQKIVSLENTEFVLYHELGHYENEHASGYGKNYSPSKSSSLDERYANMFAIFRLMPKHTTDKRNIFVIAREKGIPFEIMKAALFQLSMETDPFFKHYYDEYNI